MENANIAPEGHRLVSLSLKIKSKPLFLGQKVCLGCRLYKAQAFRRRRPPGAMLAFSIQPLVCFLYTYFPTPVFVHLVLHTYFYFLYNFFCTHTFVHTYFYFLNTQFCTPTFVYLCLYTFFCTPTFVHLCLYTYFFCDLLYT